MKEQQKNDMKKEPNDIAGNNPLNENELESVSGGFTIIDTCQKCWVEMICNAMWGQCPHLSLKPGEGNYYLASCDAGHFTNEKYNASSI
jgi:bacteriocin-like protein